MASNPLAARRAEPEYQFTDAQSRCDQLNEHRLTYLQDWFYYVKSTTGSNGKTHDSIERMDLPTGTKRWIMENQPRVKGLIRKITGGDQRLIEEIFQRAVAAAPTPIAWNNRGQ